MTLASILLGTRSTAPLIHRAGSSYLVELAGEKLFLIVVRGRCVGYWSSGSHQLKFRGFS